MGHLVSRVAERLLQLGRDSELAGIAIHNNATSELIKLCTYLEVEFMTAVQVEQEDLDALGAKFEAAATVIANEINALLQAAAAQGVTLPQGNLDSLNKALGDTQALEVPTSSPAPVDTSPADPAPVADTTAPTADPGVPADPAAPTS